MEIEDLETGKHTARGGFGGEFGGFAVDAGALGVAQGLEGIGHGKRKAGEGLTLKLALGVGSQEADVDAIGGMLIAGFGQDRVEIGRRSVESGLVEGAVERGAVGDEQAEIAGGGSGARVQPFPPGARLGSV